MARERIARILTTIGIVAMFVAFLPSLEYRGGSVTDGAMFDHLRANPKDLPFTEQHQFGIFGSPLIRYFREGELESLPDGRFQFRRSSGLEIGIFSWSSASLAIGIGLFAVARRMGKWPSNAAK